MNCIGCGTELSKYQERWKTMCVPCFRLARKVEKARVDEGVRSVRTLGIDDAMLMDLITLCHPDKHGNSELSTAVTARLLDIRRVERSRPRGAAVWGRPVKKG